MLKINLKLTRKLYKIYNLTLEKYKIKLLVNNSDKTEILNILTKKLNI